MDGEALAGTGEEGAGPLDRAGPHRLSAQAAPRSAAITMRTRATNGCDTGPQRRPVLVETRRADDGAAEAPGAALAPDDPDVPDAGAVASSGAVGGASRRAAVRRPSSSAAAYTGVASRGTADASAVGVPGTGVT